VSDTLPISEIFGPTIQGEGPSAGQRCAFIRLGGCNLTCAKCDTPYTWDASRYDLRAELSAMTADDILIKLPDAALVVISGGEPTLYQDRQPFRDLITRLSTAGRRIEIETNGTRIPSDALTWWPTVGFNVSPKLAGPMSVDAEDRRIVPAALDAYAELAGEDRAVFKFVIASPADIGAVTELVDRHHIPARAVWCMPEGATVEPMMSTARRIADPVIAAGYHLTLRQHLLLWPTDLRGR
jgi:7-carboxy-7-deazaguanine synthase